MWREFRIIEIYALYRLDYLGYDLNSKCLNLARDVEGFPFIGTFLRKVIIVVVM